jgi:hypothetical protein
MGIGLCMICIAEAKVAKPGEMKPPAFAIALVPHVQPIPTPTGAVIGLVSIGACWDHIGGGPAQQPRLLVAQGGIP